MATEFRCAAVERTPKKKDNMSTMFDNRYKYFSILSKRADF